MKKKHYLIYQITNNVNGKIYIGKHETFNVDDNYFGSGKYLKRSIKKHGLENFTKTILIELQNREEMNLLEKLVVTPEFCTRKDVYNILEGGHGGWNGIATYESRCKGQMAMCQKLKANGTNAFEIWRKKLTDDEYEKRFLQKVRQGAKHRKVKPYFSVSGSIKNHIFLSNFQLRKTICITKDSILFYDYIAEGWVRCNIRYWDKVPLDAKDASSYPNRIRRKSIIF